MGQRHWPAQLSNRRGLGRARSVPPRSFARENFSVGASNTCNAPPSSNDCTFLRPFHIVPKGNRIVVVVARRRQNFAPVTIDSVHTLIAVLSAPPLIATCRRAEAKEAACLLSCPLRPSLPVLSVLLFVRAPRGGGEPGRFDESEGEFLVVETEHKDRSGLLQQCFARWPRFRNLSGARISLSLCRPLRLLPFRLAFR